MKFFNLRKKNYSVCSVCGVHFEPAIGYEARWGHLCSNHRKDVMIRDQKKESAMNWAEENWEMVAKIMDEEKKEAKKRNQEMLETLACNISSTNSDNYHNQSIYQAASGLRQEDRF